MSQKTSPSNMPQKVCAMSDTKSADFLMKKINFSVPVNGSIGSGGFFSTKKKVTPLLSKVKLLSSEEAIELIAHQRRSQSSESSINTKKKFSPKQKQRNSPEKKKQKLSSAATFRDEVGYIPVMKKKLITRVLSPREEVLKAFCIFRIVFKDLDQEKATWHGESKTAGSRVDYDTLTILKKNGMQVNAEKMIGSVPGIEVGDEFQFRAELYLIGLHFRMSGGIDYMNKGKLILATCIVASEGRGFNDSFQHDVVIYYGERGNMTSNGKKLIKDQELVMGNLALANSQKEKTPVRVIRGVRRLDHRGKHYVYYGLYLVHEYWQVKGPRGNMVFKFKLFRV